MSSYYIDQERLEWVLDHVLDAWRRQTMIYDTTRAFLPHKGRGVPKNIVVGSSEHANFLFCACYYMRFRIKSSFALPALAQVHEKYPELFETREIAKDIFQAQHLTEALAKVGLGLNIAQTVPIWINNFRKLDQFWGGSVVNLLSGVTTYDEAIYRVANVYFKGRSEKYGYKGFRYKMVSMLMYFLMDSGIMPYYHFPLPVDFHVSRILVATECLRQQESHNGHFYNDDSHEVIRDALYSHCIKKSVSALELSNALWLLSQLGCNKHPGNMSQTGKYQARKTAIESIAFIWDQKNTKKYSGSCGLCPVEKLCSHLITWADYYVAGKLIIRGPRTKPPEYQSNVFI